MDPADRVLQSRNTSLTDAITIIQSVQKQICHLRCPEQVESLLKETDVLLDVKRGSETEATEKQCDNG